MSDFDRPPPDCENMVSLKVDNLSFRTRPQDLQEEFRRFGAIGDVYIPRDRYTRESRGFAFIRFFEKRDAEDAMDEMDGKMFDDRELRIQKAKYGRPSRPPPGRGRGGYGGDRRSGGRGGGGGGYSRDRPDRRRSRSRSRSPRRRRSYSKSPKRSRSRSRSPPPQRSSPVRRSRSRSPARSPPPE